MYQYATLDIETTGLQRYEDKINYLGIGLAKSIKSKKLDRKYILNMRKPSHRKKAKELFRLMRKHKVKLIWQNGNFDTEFIEIDIGTLLPIHHDIMLMGTAYEMDAPHDLKSMAIKYVGAKDWDIPLREKKKPNNPIVEEYLHEDIEEPWALFRFFMNNMTERDWKLYTKILKPAMLMYRRAEIRGIWLNRDKMADVRKEFEAKRKALHKQLEAQHPGVNWNAPAQVAEVLFDKEGMPIQKRSAKTKKPSADAESLKKLAAMGFELPTIIMEHKLYASADSKFLTPWEHHSQYDGRIHPHFKLYNVRTGRTACENPNLQQVTRDPRLRSLFDAPPGRAMGEADYSQLELRIAADRSGDPTMIHIYRTGGDIHTSTAQDMVGCKKLPDGARTKAKAVNFGYLYRMMDKKFVAYSFNSYGVVISMAEATRYRETYFAKYSRLLQWHRNCEIECEALGGVLTRFGRFRALPDIYSQNRWERASAARKAINTPVQSEGSDLLLGACIQIEKELGPYYDLQILGTVHDSVLFDTPEEVIEEAAQEVKRIMEKPNILKEFDIKFKVPLVADVGVGAWGSK